MFNKISCPKDDKVPRKSDFTLEIFCESYLDVNTFTKDSNILQREITYEF